MQAVNDFVAGATPSPLLSNPWVSRGVGCSGVCLSSSCVCVALGTRPEAIKFAPIVLALRRRGVGVRIVATGQHPDLAPAMLAEAGLSADIDLAVHRPGLTPAALLAAILHRLPALLPHIRPAMLLVQGDTSSALGCAMAAHFARVPVGHVEAGLRSGDPAEPFPEESQRRMIAPLAAMHFAPTAAAAATLAAEGVDRATVHLTGNSGIDAVLGVARRLRRDPVLAATMRERFAFVDDAGPPLVLVTAHRRENHGERMAGIAAAIAELARSGAARIALPVHPSPAVADVLRPVLAGVAGVHLLDPLDHAATVHLMQNAALVLTDSGGLQEEAPALGRRVLVLRAATERPEGIAAGCAELVGTDPDAIVAATLAALARGPVAPVFPYGDGRAGERIAAIVQASLGEAVTAPSEPMVATNPGKLVAIGAASSTMTG